MPDMSGLKAPDLSGFKAPDLKDLKIPKPGGEQADKLLDKRNSCFASRDSRGVCLGRCLRVRVGGA